jgi:hypothetical protein
MPDIVIDLAFAGAASFRRGMQGMAGDEGDDTCGINCGTSLFGGQERR